MVDQSYLCLGYICQVRRTVYLSTIFRTIYRHRRRLYATTYVFTLLAITLQFISATNWDKPLQTPCGYPTTTARLSCSHRVIFRTFSYELHDVHTITLRKSHGVGTLTVRLSCHYVHGYKQPSMFIFGCTLEPCFKAM